MRAVPLSNWRQALIAEFSEVERNARTRFSEWLWTRQKFHEELRDSLKDGAAKLNHDSRALAFREARAELERKGYMDGEERLAGDTPEKAWDRCAMKAAKGECQWCAMEIPMDDDPVRIANGIRQHREETGHGVIFHTCRAPAIRALRGHYSPPQGAAKDEEKR